jgi:hypothetical protein
MMFLLSFSVALCVLCGEKNPMPNRNPVVKKSPLE